VKLQYQGPGFLEIGPENHRQVWQGQVARGVEQANSAKVRARPARQPAAHAAVRRLAGQPARPDARRLDHAPGDHDRQPGLARLHQRGKRGS